MLRESLLPKLPDCRPGSAPEPQRTRREALEDAARTELDLRAGRNLLDAEWAKARVRLLAFVGILRGWDRKTTVTRLGNVEVLCQLET